MIRIPLLLTALIQLGVFLGCQRYDSAKNAPGAATVEELVELYEEAHKARSVEKLRAICFWEAQAGGRHSNHLEELMTELFNIELEEVEYVEGPPPDPHIGSTARYTRQPGAKRPLVDSMGGPIYGKLILVGFVLDDGERRPVEIDPAYIAMEFNGRYYIDILQLVVEDAVMSMQTGEPSRAQPLPLGADPPY